jgi:hypothetical protein
VLLCGTAKDLCATASQASKQIPTRNDGFHWRHLCHHGKLACATRMTGGVVIGQCDDKHAIFKTVLRSASTCVHMHRSHLGHGVALCWLGVQHNHARTYTHSRSCNLLCGTSLCLRPQAVVAVVVPSNTDFMPKELEENLPILVRRTLCPVPWLSRCAASPPSAACGQAMLSCVWPRKCMAG